jgi:hypothetical protein
MQVGNVVKCIRGNGSSIIQGNTYIISKAWGSYVNVKGCGDTPYYADRFILVSEKEESPYNQWEKQYAL